MTTFECPRCGHRVKAIALTVEHRCPAWESKNVTFKRVTEDMTNRSIR